MFVVYHENPGDNYPTMLGVFLFKCDAVAFRDSQLLSGLVVEEVSGTWGYWNHIREKLNQQVYYTDEEY
jgi:hypothetical protein